MVTRVENLYEAEGFEPVPGVHMKPLFGDGAMLNLIDIDDGAGLGEHTHPHEQLGLMLEGELALTIDGVEHAARAVGGPCRILDVFQPVREDYRERASRG